MADSIETPSSFASSGRFRVIVGVVVLLVAAAGLWWWLSQGTESTDDAQVDAHVTQIASRIGGTVLKVSVDDNQVVEAGTVLVEIDPRDYQVAVDKAKAELADAEADRHRRAEQRADHVDVDRERRQHGAELGRSGAQRHR